MTTLKSKQLDVQIDAGELVSLIKNKHEYMHQKGTPGWGHTDTEMFPIIGPTEKADFKVKIPGKEAVLDQHGLLRELDYELVKSDKDSVVFKKEYKANTQVKNSKFDKKEKLATDGKAHPEFLFWPYDFTFEKSFNLIENGLELQFTISGEKGMPFMLGYHPAFNLVSEKPVIQTEQCEIDLQEVISVGSRALSVLDSSTITLQDKKKVTLKTKGFSHFMLWTEVKNMICIEPITFYPYAVNQKNIDSGFVKLGAKSKQYSLKILV
ncbi:MAG TPA: aldose 1-epimerase [Leeuwenhoekiella sp.]|nr:aldose 1-epimerase [Leeuwenhoekiella sp.]